MTRWRGWRGKVMIAKIISLFWRAVASILLAFLMVIALIVGLIYMPIQKIFKLGPKPPPQDVMDEYGGIMGALREGDITFLQSYGNSNPDFINGIDGFSGHKWLTNAIGEGALEAIQWFIDQGADVNYQDDDGFSPLKTAIQRDADSKHHQRENDAPAVVKLLLEAGADVNAQGTLDETPLHVAASWPVSIDTVKLLLDWGANPRAQNSDYSFDTPTDLARSCGHHETFALLKEYTDQSRGDE